ncbi:acyl-CoA dehydrogenase family protein [Rhodococcus sp. C26F]|uniref:Alkylation response protein AidB-like acyl-CoA dehydrogenase n=1 Tax=Rhodococcus rhodochrous J45 TaxID=935266 RepID=A0A562DZD4_RHORH|nr:acyl-CoA dehydrogenase family protein [Rhodococcus rhodochrous]TWH14923.1 alkylation response protein AidB-like acyl-CoA dehydrogenase [Rhodococcus rhodochrous J45]
MTLTAPVPSTYQQRARGAEYLARAREVAKVIDAEANAIEAGATITRPVYDALAEAGLFWILVPEEYGGAGLDIVSAFKVIQELTRADGSTGWAFMANSCSTGVAVGYTNPEGAREMFAGVDKGITAGMVVPTGKGVRVEGGYRVTGRFQFASGSAHASWIGAGFVVHDDQGNPIVDADGQPEARIAWIPKEKVEFLGNWSVMGMVGTGSYDYQVNDEFVPERFTMDTFSTVPVRPEAVYKLGLLGIGVGGHAPVALGLAERALEEIARIVSGKVRPGYDGFVGDSDVFRIEFARHEALFKAACAFVYEVFGDAEDTAAAGLPISEEQHARLRQAATWVQEVAGDVVMFAHRWAGSATVRTPSVLGRCVRDAAVATQHALIDRMTLSDAAGAILPGYQQG